VRFEFTEPERAFHADLNAFLDAELPPDWAGPPDESRDDHWRLTLDIRRKLAERGWLVMSWPREYGGSDSSPMMNVIFSEVMAYRRAPGNERFGTRMIGPTLMAFGSDEQKREHLPRIARGEVQWCQGYSEPDAGSDLASLQTRAVGDGDEFVINGTKIWNTLAHRADMMFLLARTDPAAPRHRGITMFLADMKSPGVTVRPLVNMAGSHSFNQVTFDDVRVPASNVVGEINDGWRVGLGLLNFERSGIDYVGWAQRTLDELRAHIVEHDTEAAGDPIVRDRFAQLDADIEAARLLTYESAWLQGQGQTPSMEPSMSKMAASEVCQDVHEFGLEFLGMNGLAEPGNDGAVLQGRILKLRLFYVSGTILAGTNEIQRNIIAQRGLGLPRE
jgi:hypothetical protein